jgi:hypothetical protein
MGLRIYNVDENSGEPTINTGYLVQTGSSYDFSSPPGTKVQVNFDGLSIPGTAGQKLYAVVWSFCTVQIPKGIDETGNIIWDKETLGFRLGGAIFSFKCAAGGKLNSVCAYSKE